MKKLFLFVFLSVFFSASFLFANEIDKCFDFYDAGDYQRAVAAGERAVIYYPYSVEAYYCLGESYRMLGQFNKAIENLKKADKFASSKKDLMLIYNKLGLAYESISKLDDALFYHNKALQLSKHVGTIRDEAKIFNNIALIYSKQLKSDKALEYFNLSLKLDSSDENKLYVYNNIGLIYGDLKKYKEAEKYLKLSYDLAAKKGDNYALSVVLLNLGEIYIYTKKYNEAEKFLNESLDKILKIGNKQLEGKVYLNKAKLNIEKGDKGDITKGYLDRAYRIFNDIGAVDDADYAFYLKQSL